MAEGESRPPLLVQDWPRQAASFVSSSRQLTPYYHGRSFRCAQSLTVWRALALDPLLPISGLDEAALSLQRCDVGTGQLLADLAKSRPACGKPLDQSLIHRLSLAVLFLAVGGRHAFIAVDEPGQVDRHQPPRVLRRRVECLDAFERLPQRGQNLADGVELSLRGRGQGTANAIDVRIEPFDHRAVGEIG